MTKVFIDGSAGTTGLKIRERLGKRSDLSLIEVPQEERKDPAARQKAMQEAEIVFLCLPDDAAREAALLAGDRVVIDTSTAHRCAPGWVYGFPELAGQREKIRSSLRIANPGCHASGFIALLAPLVERGLVPRDLPVSATSLTGYTGGGRKMIESYAENGAGLRGMRTYALSQSHKHLPEMMRYTGLEHRPVFLPIVGAYPQGMEVLVPLPLDLEPEAVLSVYREVYQGGMVRTGDLDEAGFLSSDALAGTDEMRLMAWGRPGQLVLSARFDNLGKGACGAAIQNMNLVLGLAEDTGLERSQG